MTVVPTEGKPITFSFIACTDKDLNNYSIVQIGLQTWMAENLKTTKYNDGTAINNLTDATAWSYQYSPVGAYPRIMIGKHWKGILPAILMQTN
jgi:hypothetical protein